MTEVDNKTKGILVAVYGSLRKGFGNSPLLKQSEFISTTKTKDRFLMYDVGSFPMMFKPDDSSLGSRVAVEVYEVDKHTLATLDMLEGVPNLYNRYVINNIEGLEGENVYMYITNPEYYEEVDKKCTMVKSGDWLKHRPDLKKLYDLSEEREKRLA